MTPTSPLLVFGIGNPGKEYAHTYHNAGILAAEYFAAKRAAGKFRAAREFAYAPAGALIIARSLRFMNESGIAVSSALRYFKLPPSSLLLIHDESDVPVGAHKFSFGRGSAGHRGVASAIASLGTKDFWRMRIGIRPKAASGTVRGRARVKAGDFVLRAITARDRAALEATFAAALEEIPLQIQTEAH